jgi:dihydrolipoamide dehydrogenase
MVDVVIIGEGTAGLAAYRAASAKTESVLLIGAGTAGTTCARVGCMPSKLLVAAANAAHGARHAALFGIACKVEPDGAAVMARVRRERDRFVDFVVADVNRIPDAKRMRGRARFVAPGVLDVDGKRILARSVVIATGSSAHVPPFFDGIRDRLVVNDDVFEWPSLPESIAVFGLGAIGLELGQSFHRLGVRVRIFGRGGKIGPLTDPVVRAAAVGAFRSELPIFPDAKVQAVKSAGAGVAVLFEDDAGAVRTETFERALVAVGRRPNTDGLGLENAGVTLDARGLPIFDRTTLQCGLNAVFVAGDVNDDAPLLHEAADEGAIAGANAAAYPNVTPRRRRSLLSIIFSDPEIAIVGPSFLELSGRGAIAIGTVSFEDQGRSRIMGENRGAGRLYADPSSRRFLGAEIAGPRAEHLGHLLAWAHQQELTIDRMLEMPFYHPVVEEGLRTALRDAQARLDSGDSA